MGLHFIKNGIKNDVCVKRPSLFPASATTYDNSQSGLSATRVQGAIDELKAKIDRGSVSVTADGVKTYSALLTELLNASDVSKITAQSYIDRNNKQFYALSEIDNGNWFFTKFGVSVASCGLSSLRLRSDSSYFQIWYAAAGGNTFSDLSSTVVASGETITLHY